MQHHPHHRSEPAIALAAAEVALAFSAALDALHVGALLVDGAGNIVLGSSIGLSLMSSEGPFRRVGDRLRLQDGAAHKIHQDNIGRLVSGAEASSVQCVARGGVSWLVVGVPLAAGDHRNVILLFQRVGTPAPVSPTILRAAFGLGHAEAALASALSGGISIADYAESIDRKESTLRNQLQSIFQKTRTRSQAQLVALSGGLRVGIAPDPAEIRRPHPDSR